MTDKKEKTVKPIESFEKHKQIDPGSVRFSRNASPVVVITVRSTR